MTGLIPRKVLLELGSIVTPDTSLRSDRQLIARKFDFSDRRQYIGVSDSVGC